MYDNRAYFEFKVQTKYRTTYFLFIMLKLLDTSHVLYHADTNNNLLLFV